jgi:hypothetical protein
MEISLRARTGDDEGGGPADETEHVTPIHCVFPSYLEGVVGAWSPLESFRPSKMASAPIGSMAEVVIGSPISLSAMTYINKA